MPKKHAMTHEKKGKKHKSQTNKRADELARERLDAVRVERERILGSAHAEAERIMRNARDAARAYMARSAREAEQRYLFNGPSRAEVEGFTTSMATSLN
jgi:F0F1-type ATP synthase membrane subunit b/b'